MDRIAFARRLRREESWAERLIWRWLRDRRFEGHKFRRQAPKGDWFVDFLCEEASLAIELDGSQHGHPEQQSKDAEKERYLATLSIKTLRFWNGDLRRREREIKDMIFAELAARAPRPMPSYWRKEVVGGENDARPHPGTLPRGEGRARPLTGPLGHDRGDISELESRRTEH